MTSKSLHRTTLAFGLTLGCVGTLGRPTGAAPPPGASKPIASQPAAPSNTTIAERTLRVTWAPSQGAPPPDVAAVVGRLETPEVGGKIGEELTGLTAEQAASTVRFSEPRLRDGSAIEVDITVELDPANFPKARPAARELADRMVETFTQLLAEDRKEQDAPRLTDAKRQLAEVQYDFESTARQIKDRAAQMGDQSPEGARAALGRLEDERQKLELDLAGMQARQKAVESWIDRTSKQLQEQAKADPIIAELEKAVAAQEKLVAMAHKQYESAVISQAEVGAAEAKLSDVKIQLMERQRAAGGATDPLASLNQELQKLSIDVVDRKARLEFVDKRVPKLREAAAMASELESLEASQVSLRREMEQARQELRAVERSTQGAGARDRVVVVRARQGKHVRPPGSFQVPEQKPAE